MIFEGVFLSVFSSQIWGRSKGNACVSFTIVSIFYREFGHMIIDKMSLPIFGLEEEVADVLSILMIDHVYDEKSA